MSHFNFLMLKINIIHLNKHPVIDLYFPCKIITKLSLKQGLGKGNDFFFFFINNYAIYKSTNKFTNLQIKLLEIQCTLDILTLHDLLMLISIHMSSFRSKSHFVLIRSSIIKKFLFFIILFRVLYLNVIFLFFVSSRKLTILNFYSVPSTLRYREYTVLVFNSRHILDHQTKLIL